MKLILCLSEQLTGLKINFHKSKLFCFGKAKEAESEYRQLFGCEVGSLPFTYLGIPIHHRKLTNKEWKIIEDRFEKKLSSWKGKLNFYRSSSFGTVMSTRGNTDLQNGTFCVGLRIKVFWVLKT